MATAFPIRNEKPSEPPESDQRPIAVVRDTRTDTHQALRLTELPQEIVRAEMAARLDVDQINIADLQLRPNQLRAIQALKAFLLQTQEDSGYFIQPTGAGKTFTFGLISKLVDVNTLILVPTKQLIQQTKAEFMEGLGFTEDEIGVIQPGKPVPQGKKVLISTYGSHVSRLKLGEGSFDLAYRKAVVSCPLVICDEAHRALGDKTAGAIGLSPEEEWEQQAALENLETFTSAQSLKLGFTATPDLSQKNVGRCFGSLIAEESFANLREAGILVPHRSHTIVEKCEEQEITDQTTSREEGEALRKHDMYRKMQGKWQEVEKAEKEETKREKPLRTIVFCANTTECEKWAEQAQEFGIRCSIVTYKQGDEAVGIATRQLLNGEIDQIVTVNKLAEGFDCRPINCVMMARATHSPVKIAQPVGRGLRAQKKHEDERFGEKKHCHVIEGKFMLSPMSKTNKQGAAAEAPAIEEDMATEEETIPTREGLLKREAATMTFDEYLQMKEGLSGEVVGAETTTVRFLDFDQNGVATIQIDGEPKKIVYLEAYIQNFPFIDVDKLTRKGTPELIRLNENLCRLGQIHIKHAYLKSDIDELIKEVYSSEIRLSKEGVGILIFPEETIKARRLIGPEVVSTEYIGRQLAGFVEKGTSWKEIIKILSAHGIQRVPLPQDMTTYTDHGKSGWQFIESSLLFYKSDIDALEEEITAPESEENLSKASFLLPEDKDSDIEFIIRFEDGKEIQFLSFGRKSALEDMIKELKDTVERIKDDEPTLRFLYEKLMHYLDKLIETGMVSNKGIRMSQKVVEELVIDPLDKIIDGIEEKIHPAS